MISFRFCRHLTPRQCPFSPSEEEEDEEEDESEDEGGDLVLQSSSLSAMDDEKDPMEPPAKMSRTTFNLHSLTDSTQP